MHRVVPELILENYRAGRHRGEFEAVGLFLDLSGFSTMTDTLMQHGQHGAEVLAGLMHGLFDPLVESIFGYGGKIIGFAGDGIMALYPIEGDARITALRAATSAALIQRHFQELPSRQTLYGAFSISAKLGLAMGSVSWGILCSATCDQATYYFRGSAVDESAQAEHHARAGDILLAPNIRELLGGDIQTSPFGSYHRFIRFQVDMPPAARVVLPPMDPDVASLFMPQEVIEHDVRGEFRQVVNLFMRFPDLSEGQLEGLVATIFDLRKKYGGLLNRLDFGDKGCNMLLLWGAPIAYGNDIGRALHFLLDLKATVDFPITAGVTYYISHAGYLGSSLYEDYTCYGWGVNLASRFMMTAPAGQVWVDERIARRVSNWFEIEFLHTRSFKGFAVPQQVYVLHGDRPTAEPVYQGQFVGREAELEQLAHFLEPIWNDAFAGAILILGDAGIGKGRLVYEVRSSKRFEGRRVLWAVCHADQIHSQSFNPLRSWLLRYFGILPGQSSQERRRSFDRKLDELAAATGDPELVRELERTRSVLGALLDLHWPGSLYEQLDAEGRYNNTFLALIALLKAESRRRPLVLFVEDLQFVDRDTRDFLAHLKRAVLAGTQSFPIAIILTTRPQGPAVESGLADEQITLRGLPREALARHMETMLGGPVAPGLVSVVMERSEGNPYFTEQIIRYLQEEGLLETSRAGWSLSQTLEEISVPGDVRAVLVARLDQLARGVRETVQTASVLGRRFEVPLLARMLQAEDRVHRHLQEAEQASIWNRLDDLHYVFSHGLLRDAAYEMQMQSRRTELHALAVEALEQLYGESRDRYPELAHHAGHAGVHSRARRYYTLAGQTAAESYHNHQAVEYFKRALGFTPPDDLSTQFSLLMERAEVYNRLGERAAELSDLQALEEIALQLDDRDRLARVKALHARYCFITGDYPGTIEIAHQVASIAQELGQEQAALGIHIVWSQALFRLGNLDQAMKCAEDGLRLARRLGDRVAEGWSNTSMGLIALESKEPGVAQAYLETAIGIAHETNERRLEARAIANLANSAAYIQKDYVTARSYYERSHQLNTKSGDRYAQGLDLTNLGWVSGMLGDLSAARKFHGQALVIAREVGNIYQETYTLMNLSRVAEMQGKADEALQYARQAMELSKRAGDRSAEAWSYLYLGYAHAMVNELLDARMAFESALAIRRELGQSSLAMEPLAGLTEVALRLQNTSLVQTLMEELMSALLEESALEATEEPLRVFLTCYRGLERMRDSRAIHILRRAVQLLDAQVAQFKDETARRTYIDNVPWRRAVEKAWLSLQASG